MTREDPAAFAPPPAFGPFRVLHQIGSGALGPVYRTYEPTRDRLIAVKVFRLDVTPEQAQALADELSKAADAGLFHPSIVEPVAAGIEGTVAYRAEEYVAAESLDIAMREYAPAPVEQVLPFITQLAGAIDFARAAGFGHGALHLRDVFVTPDEARASGFGVVDALERLGLRAPVRRPYSAPERIAGEAWSTPADVFSLAAICYELMTARRPAGTSGEVGPLDASEAGEHAAIIHSVLARAMDDDPAARFPSALAFAAALEAAARGEQVSDAAAHPGALAATPVAAAAVTPTAEPEAFDSTPRIDDDEDAEEIEDIAVERDEDEEYYDLAQADRLELEANQDDDPLSRASLFDDEGEAAADLALEQPPDRFTDFAEPEVDDHAPAHAFAEPDDAESDDRLTAAAALSLLDEAPDDEGAPDRRLDDEYAREEVQAAIPYGEPEWRDGRDSTHGTDGAAPIYVTTDSGRDYGGAAPVPPSRLAMPSIAIGVLVGLLVGFAAAYAIFGGSPAEPVAQDARQAAGDPGSPAPGGTLGQAAPSDTEQPLAAPTAAPDIPDEVPPPDSPAAATGPTTGSLVINSTPAKAAVTINDQWRGRTPLRLEEQAFGTYNVRVVQDGYAVATEDVVLSSSAPARTLSFKLERSAQAAAPAKPAPSKPSPAKPAPRAQAPARTAPPAPLQPTAYLGSIFVDSRPQGARVSVNGKPMGTTPIRIPEVPIGSHVVRLELDAHRVWATSARVQAGQETRVTGSLDPIR
ncbi:MAG: PEGA domain-containing protein [Acidobacteria bacterium]|nr:PEGA domain-containing protein [Acidobacteriota bacterium]